MMGWENMPMLGDGQMTTCPLCNAPVRLTYNDNQYLDHYEYITHEDYQANAGFVSRLDKQTASKLRKARNGKRTLAIVGMAPATCALAPFDEPGVGLGRHIEIWGMNEAHDLPWMKNWTRWFQLHPKEYFSRAIDPIRKVKGHYQWLQEKHDKPIYMQFKYSEIPDSVEYPLYDIVDKYFGKFKHGDKQIKYFTNSVAYMIALALYEGKFDRIELYGVEMANDTEYIHQKSGATFWIGAIAASGLEFYIPESSHLLSGPLYAYQGQGARNIV